MRTGAKTATSQHITSHYITAPHSTSHMEDREMWTTWTPGKPAGKDNMESQQSIAPGNMEACIPIDIYRHAWRQYTGIRVWFTKSAKLTKARKPTCPQAPTKRTTTTNNLQLQHTTAYHDYWLLPIAACKRQPRKQEKGDCTRITRTSP